MKSTHAPFSHILMLATAFCLATAGCKLAPQPSAYRDIHAAARDGNVPEVTADLEHNPGDLNLPDDAGLTPLHLAAAYCHTNVVMLLLNRGASIDGRAQGGATALHLAAQEDCPDVVNLLLARGASVNARDDQNRTALARAEQWHQEAIASLLRQHGGTE